MQCIGRAKLHPSRCLAADPSPPRGAEGALRREVSLGMGTATHQLAAELLSGWLRGFPVWREPCGSLRVIAHGGDACKIIALHPEQAGCSTLPGLGLLCCRRLSPARAGLLRRGTKVAGEKIEGLQPCRSVCTRSVPARAGGVGGKLRHWKGKRGIGCRTHPPVGRRLRVSKGFTHPHPFEIRKKK